MDFAHPYITMDPSYEAGTLRAFGGLVEKGFIERNFKTVAWCSSCRTTLATAEIEYQDRKDPSIYVMFSVERPALEKLMGFCCQNCQQVLPCGQLLRGRCRSIVD